LPNFEDKKKKNMKRVNLGSECKCFNII